MAAQQRVVDELVVALVAGDIERALALLAPDAVLVSDGGAAHRAARHPVVGAERVARLLANLARRNLDASVSPVRVNGDPGFVLARAGRPDTVVAFGVAGGVVAAIWLVRNPDKLDHMDRTFAIR